MTELQPLSITAAEVDRGWVEFACSKHGVIVVGPARCVVACGCGRRAKPGLNGTTLTKRDIERLLRAIERAKDETSKNAAKTPANSIGISTGARIRPSQATDDPRPSRRPSRRTGRESSRKEAGQRP